MVSVAEDITVRKRAEYVLRSLSTITLEQATDDVPNDAQKAKSEPDQEA